MLFLIAFIGAAVIAVVLWKALNTAARTEAGPQPPPHRTSSPPTPPRVSGPDDDADFLRQLDEKVKRRDEPPSA